MPLENPNRQRLRAAHGFLELGMFDLRQAQETFARVGKPLAEVEKPFAGNGKRFVLGRKPFAKLGYTAVGGGQGTDSSLESDV